MYYTIKSLIKKGFIDTITLEMNNVFEKIIGRASGIFNIITLINLAFGVVCFLLGLIFFTSPNFSSIVVSILTGIILIANGIISIYSYIKRNGIELFNYNLVLCLTYKCIVFSS